MCVCVCVCVCSGIGLESARSLAKRNAHIVLGVRSVEKGQEAVTSIIRSSGAKPENFTVLKLDLNSFAGVRSFVDEYKKTKLGLNILILNAGIFFTPHKVTADGFEEVLQVNHLSQFLLTNLLLPIIIASSSKAFPSRIVTVSSVAHQFGGINWTDINHTSAEKYDAMAAYAQSKTANILFAKELHTRYHEKHGIIVVRRWRWMDGWMDGWMNEMILVSLI
jgi:NAD(P)-dependent dehydrogenase (short-subunit alcohol dehydrogenase family)